MLLSAIIKPLINEMAGAVLRIFPHCCHLKYPVWKGRVGDESSPRDKCYLISILRGNWVSQMRFNKNLPLEKILNNSHLNLKHLISFDTAHIVSARYSPCVHHAIKVFVQKTHNVHWTTFNCSILLKKRLLLFCLQERNLILKQHCMSQLDH